MFGFFVGTASLIGLFYVLRRGRWHHGHGGHGYGHGWHGRGMRRSWMFRWLFQRLDTTPGQEKVFESAAEDLEGRVRQMASELEQLRRDAAKAMRGEAFDASAIRESFARQRAHLDTLEESVVGHLGKAHEALRPEQRQTAAELLENGPRGSRCGGHVGRGHGGWKYA